MLHLENMIDELTTRAEDSDLIALLATSRKARLKNAALARGLRDVVGALKHELQYRQSLADLTIGKNSSWIAGGKGGFNSAAKPETLDAQALTEMRPTTLSSE